MATLYVNRSDSRCGACNKGADPHEESHITIVGWFAGDGKGCGEVFDALDSDYNDHDGLHEDIRNIRPDLPWVGA